MYLVNFILNNKKEQEIVKASCGDEALDIIFIKHGKVEILVCERYSK